MTQPQVVVSKRDSRSRRILISALVCMVLLAVVGAYELGQYRAGFSRVDSLQQAAALEDQNRELQFRNRELSEQLAILETAAKVDQAAYGEVENQLQQMQDQILQQQEDIEFYKGIVNENDGTGLRIQDFEVSAGVGPRHYELRLVLAQAFRSTRQVSGTVEILLEGMQGTEVARLSLPELADPQASDTADAALEYSFKYFQDLKAAIVLPEGFEPERFRVIVRPKGRGSKTVEDIFEWDAKAG